MEPSESAGTRQAQPATGGGFAAPVVSVPKGGGALRGVGENFAVAAVTGTAGLTVPLPLSPGRSGFGPALALSYDSGAGNGPFGLGWSLGLPAVTRRTDKGLPRYLDGDESDVFLLSGAEDLVPALVEDTAGRWTREAVPDRTVDGRTFRIARYRPRVEGAFARIERWTDTADGTSHWRTISGDNVTTVYGADDDSRVQDPDAPPGAPRVFSWLISESSDDKGNIVQYRYRREDAEGVDVTAAHESGRAPAARTAQRYLDRVRYGNRTSSLADTPPGPDEWMFEAVFDYGDHDPAPTATGTWPSRLDSFSTRRTGFEVRTYRLCRRVLMFHHFPDEPTAGRNCLVRALELAYDEQPVASLLVAATQRGYRRTPGGLVSRALPPLELSYQPISLGESPGIRTLDDDGRFPAIATTDRATWVDLDGDGIPGVLAATESAWFYAPNQGGRLGVPEALAAVPAAPSATPGAGGRLLDVAGDGRLDVVALTGASPGFFKRTERRDWEPHRAFAQLPNVDWSDANTRLVDLNGDGRADVLVTEGDAITWYPSAGEEGFGPAVRVPTGTETERRPTVVFADAENALFLADMTGDGLADLVRVRHDEVRYWPNLGYGRFGDAVVMDDPPVLDTSDVFDPRRVLLADLDGAGPHDLLYLGASGTRAYVNQCGNRWAPPVALPYPPTFERPDAVDVFGTGTPCLVWMSRWPADASAPVRYLELMPRGKPHLLTGMRNNLGTETAITYSTSTAFRLADQAAGRPWATQLPFVVHVVSRVDTVDHVSRSRFTTRYAYHHGYYDGTEREFRGFARVDQWDTEQFADLSGSLGVPASWPEPANLDAASHTPPVRTTTWHHTGAFTDMADLATVLAQEYYREDDRRSGSVGITTPPPRLLDRDGTRTPWHSTADEAREACRAMRGAVLRREVYAEDGSAAADHPYTVEEFAYSVDALQPRGPNRNSVFLRHRHEAVMLHYERTGYDGRATADPRTVHELILETDGFGNPRHSASVAYARRRRDTDPRLTEADHAAQQRPRISVTDRAYTAPTSGPDNWRTPLPCEARVYELHGYPPPAPESPARLVQLEVLAQDLAGLRDGHADLPFLDVDASGAGPGPHRRLIEHQRTLYRTDDLTGPAPLGHAGTRAVPHETYRLAFTSELLADAYRRDGEPLLTDPAAVLSAAGYRDSAGLSAAGGFPAADPPGLWWQPSGTVRWSTATGDELHEAKRHFFVPRRHVDPFGAITSVVWDDADLMVRETVDARGNRTTAGERRPQGTAWRNDYRVLAPEVVTDPNGNRSAAAFDALGLTVGTAVLGKVTATGADEDLGDTLDGFVADLPEDVVRAHLARPLDAPLDILGNATTRVLYDVDAFRRWRRTATDPGTGAPPSAILTLSRERHARGPDSTPVPRVRALLTYADGSGRVIGRKTQAEAGPLVEGGPDVGQRWVGTGWTVFDNKGRPVRQYEPFFSDTPAFEPGAAHGVGPVLCRDPLGRVAATLYPDHTWEKTVFDPWHRTTYDRTDTIAVDDPGADPHAGPYLRRLPPHEYLPSWRNERLAGPPGPQREAAQQSEIHADTPASAFVDTLGHTFLTIAVNRSDRDGGTATEHLATRVDHDIQGNDLAVHDALGRLVMRYTHDMLGRRIRSASMDSGERWTLADVQDAAVRTWNTLRNDHRATFDELRRPTAVFLRRAGDRDEVTVERTAYGDDPAYPGGPDAAAAANLLGRVHEVYDGAGVVIHAAYDFTGNLVRSERRLAADYRGTPDWGGPPVWEGPAYPTKARFDALGRPIAVTLPDGTLLTPGYNDAALLDTVTARVRGADSATAFVTGVDYDAQGRRTAIAYGNGTRTGYRYDPRTFRLVGLHTTRGPEFRDDCPDPARTPCGVQSLSYTYDPEGNVTHIRDDAQQAVFFRNQRVEPGARYFYDAVFRLIEASGREHVGQAAVPSSPTDAPRTGLAHPGDGAAMARYRERYTYDAVGNLRAVDHASTDPASSALAWSRAYEYLEPSPLEPDTASSRLSHTTTGGVQEPYRHDGHGNVTAMPHLGALHWDHRDRLAATSAQRTATGTPETTYYVYDRSGQRVRKVTERYAPAGSAPVRLRERVYLGAVEVYREYGPDGRTVTLERETLHVMDDASRVAMVETRTGGTDAGPAQLIRYQLADHAGSTALELDDRARVVSYEEYHPYGSTAYQAVASAVQAPKRYRFTAKERDEETGLAFHGARYYAPWLGRWTGAEPRFDARRNVGAYTYCGGNPVGRVDADGGLDVPSWVPGASEINAWRNRFVEDHEYAVEFTKAFVRDNSVGIVGLAESVGILDEPNQSFTAQRAQRDAEALTFVAAVATGVHVEGGPGPGGPGASPAYAGAGRGSPAAGGRTPPTFVPPALQAAKSKEEQAGPDAKPKDAVHPQPAATTGPGGAPDPGMPSGPGKGSAKASAPKAGKSSASSDPGGQWREVARRSTGKAGSKGMTSLEIQSAYSEKPIEYRDGRAYIEEYRLDGTDFDKYDPSTRTLGEVKDEYGFLIKMGSRKAADGLLSEAGRQSEIAQRHGLTLEWMVREEYADAYRTLLHDQYPEIQIKTFRK